MPVFFLLVILGAVALWFLACAIYRPIGRLVHKISKNAMDELNATDEAINENGKNEIKTESKKENI